jgi:predicted NBD/HSP70 family sugar kinase
VADLIAAAAGNVFRGHPLPAAVGICLGGTVVDQGGVSVVERGSFLHWDHVPIAAMVQERLRIPASVMNDVTALTVGHHWFGAGVGQDSLLVYGVGAGIGAGIVMHNRVVTGAHGISGHVGHERVGGRGVTCGRGHTDCVHSFVSIPAITQNAEANSYEEALERADRGVSVALRAFRSAAHALGVTVAEAVNIIDPGRVIVTGEGLDMLRIAEPSFHEGVVDHLEQRDAETVEIVFPAFDFTHYARGAAIAAMSALL